LRIFQLFERERYKELIFDVKERNNRKIFCFKGSFSQKSLNKKLVCFHHKITLPSYDNSLFSTINQTFNQSDINTKRYFVKE